jgi:hypothetical protein
MWMAVTVNSCPEGKCWIAFSGGVVVVGCASVGVSTGGRGVDVGDATCCVGGMLEGTIVPATGMFDVAQPANDKMIMLNKSRKDILLIINSSFDQSPWIIASRDFLRIRS